MPAIERIKIKGFKSLACIDGLPLRQINVLIGANGSGKSNFVEAFALLRAVAHGDLRKYVGQAGGAEQMLHFGRRTTDRMVIHCMLRDAMLSYEVELRPSQSDGLFISSEAATTHKLDDNGKHFVTRYTLRDAESGINNLTDYYPTIERVRAPIEKWQVYHFHDTSWLSPMKKTADLHDNRYLRADGSNLAAFLYLLRLKYFQSYKAIRSVIRLAAPFFDDFELDPASFNENTIRLRWKHRGSTERFDVASLSDGTLRFIALATLLLQPPEIRPSVIIMDEPELGLHPAAIVLLASLIKKASVHSQIVLGTQSSHLLDHFDPEDVLVANREKGATTLTRLESDELKAWLEDYSLGELWEKNEIGGRPMREFVG